MQVYLGLSHDFHRVVDGCGEGDLQPVGDGAWDAPRGWVVATYGAGCGWERDFALFAAIEMRSATSSGVWGFERQWDGFVWALEHAPRVRREKGMRMVRYRSRLAGLLCAVLISQPLLSPGVAEARGKAAKEPAKAPALSSDQRILHLLDRLSFGPTPESIAAVRKMGLYRWFEEQLDPEEIDDMGLETRLKSYPAMDLPADELLTRLPSGAVIRQVADGKLPMPDDAQLARIYRHRVDIYQDKQEKKAAEKTDAGMMMPATGPAAVVPTVSPARLTYGELLVKSVLGLGPDERLERVLGMGPHAYEEFRSVLKGAQREHLMDGMTEDQRELLASFDNPGKAVTEELMGQRLLRDVYSERQLLEVMTGFWMNHFNVYLKKNEEAPYYIASYERDTIRPMALGRFEDLLVATAKSPAMLTYLDNATSTGPDSAAAESHARRQALGKEAKGPLPGLNENYARELMELHTLGVNGGYTQKDVTEVARIFTGWTVDHAALGGEFRFDETRHEPGEKTVLGHKFKEQGQKEGLKLLHMLATSPSTARFIATKLAVAFVSDTPPEALVARMAHSFEDNDGDISAVLRTMVHSPEFWAPEAYQAKVKTPLEYVVSAARASGAEIPDPQPLANQLNQMGMPLYGSMPPTGYPAKAEDWVSTGALVERMNFAVALAGNRLGKIRTDWAAVTGAATDPAAEELALEQRLLPGGVSEKTRAATLDELGAQFPAPAAGARPLNENRQAARAAQERAVLAGMLIGSPEFQRR